MIVFCSRNFHKRHEKSCMKMTKKKSWYVSKCSYFALMWLIYEDLRWGTLANAFYEICPCFRDEFILQTSLQCLPFPTCWWLLSAASDLPFVTKLKPCCQDVCGSLYEQVVDVDAAFFLAASSAGPSLGFQPHCWASDASLLLYIYVSFI